MNTIGSHKLTHGSLTDPQVDSMLLGERVHVLYSDPPWGNGNLSYWQTMNKKMTGQDAVQVSHDQMRDRILTLAQNHVDGYVFIETGLRWKGYWLDAMRSIGLSGCAAHRIWYKSGSKMLENVLLSGHRPGVAPINIGNVEHINGAALSAFCVKSVAKPGAIVFDPCCGMGYTARAAVGAGMVFRGNELNATRLAKTTAFLTCAIIP